MSRVRSQNTSPELQVRKVAHSLGLRFRLHRRDLPGTPDMLFPKHKIALFVHGFFWHHHAGCKRAAIPPTRVAFWQQKLEQNVKRDSIALDKLRKAGWRPEVIWECQTRLPQDLSSRPKSIFINDDTNYNVLAPIV